MREHINEYDEKGLKHGPWREAISRSDFSEDYFDYGEENGFRIYFPIRKARFCFSRTYIHGIKDGIEEGGYYQWEPGILRPKLRFRFKMGIPCGLQEFFGHMEMKPGRVYILNVR